jgi:hypothetical protein
MLFQRGIDNVKITALSNHKPGILNNYIEILFLVRICELITIICISFHSQIISR